MVKAIPKIIGAFIGRGLLRITNPRSESATSLWATGPQLLAVRREGADRRVWLSPSPLKGERAEMRGEVVPARTPGFTANVVPT